MSLNQYTTEFHYHSLMFQQHQQNEQQQQQYQNDSVEEQKEALFEKPLTPSDVGKLNRLVIPKQHAERYFPLAAAEGLLLCFEDEEGKQWRFRYSYWNSSQSYVLTKGWSRFVKEKHLDAGDVVLFHRHRVDAGRFFIGWRRRDAPPLLHNNLSHLQYYPNSGGEAVENQRSSSNSKTLRLFGVNMECQLDSDWSEPSTPDYGSTTTTCPTNHDQFPFYPQQQHYAHPYYMDISLSGDHVKQT